MAADPQAMKDALVLYGYDPRLDLKHLVTAFQRHFEPEAFTDDKTHVGTPTERTAARLNALLRMKR